MTCSVAPAQALSCSSYVLANAIVRTIEMLTRGVHCLCQKITALFLRASSFRVKHHEEESTAPPGSYMLYILKKKKKTQRIEEYAYICIGGGTVISENGESDSARQS